MVGVVFFSQGSVEKAKIDTFILLTALRLRSERESSSSVQGKKLARLASFKIRVPLWELSQSLIRFRMLKKRTYRDLYRLATILSMFDKNYFHNAIFWCLTMLSELLHNSYEFNKCTLWFVNLVTMDHALPYITPHPIVQDQQAPHSVTAAPTMRWRTFGI